MDHPHVGAAFESLSFTSLQRQNPCWSPNGGQLARVCINLNVYLVSRVETSWHNAMHKM